MTPARNLWPRFRFLIPYALNGSAHEHVQRRVAPFRPGMDADMGFGQHRNAGYAGIGGEVMQMNMQQRRPGGRHRFTKRAFYVPEIVQPMGAAQIHDQVGACVTNAFALDEVILRRRRANAGMTLDRAGARVHPQFSGRGRRHQRPPVNQQMNNMGCGIIRIWDRNATRDFSSAPYVSDQ